ncbi:hypothetical protein R1sor_000212 [Riccia sorocarpa]|uniref:Uncharacterized protein n=1 Tax=Riccia sorocarpa TaxID=122646 RepID=A0ABD3GVL7_9MARC
MASVIASWAVVAPSVGIASASSSKSSERISVQVGLKGSVFSGKSEWQSKTQTNGSRVSCMQATRLLSKVELSSSVFDTTRTSENLLVNPRYHLLHEANIPTDSHLQDAGHTATGMVSTEGSQVPANVEVTKQPIELLGKEVKAYLHSLNYDDDTMRTAYAKYGSSDVHLEPAVNCIFDDEVNAGRPSHKERVLIGKKIPFGCGVSRWFYFHVSPELKVVLAVYTALIGRVDDLCSTDPTAMISELQRTILNWGSGDESHRIHAHLSHLQRLVRIEIPKHYGPVVSVIIIQGTIDYLVGCIMESWKPEGIACPATSSRFPAYMRGKSGLGVPYAHFIFPEKIFPEAKYLEIYLPAIPDIANFTVVVNDILSYYKESLDEGDENTYLKTMSRILGCNAADLWRSTFECQMKLTQEITATLSRREDLQQAWLSFRDAYIL